MADPDHEDHDGGDTDDYGELLNAEEAQVVVEKHIVHSSEETRLFQCGLCQKFQTGLKKILATHILKHLNIYLYKCDTCQRKFRQQGNFNRHMKTHHRSEEETKARKALKSKKPRSREQTQSEKYSNVSEVQAEDIRAVPLEDLDGKLVRYVPCFFLLVFFLRTY